MAAPRETSHAVCKHVQGLRLKILRAPSSPGSKCDHAAFFINVGSIHN